MLSPPVLHKPSPVETFDDTSSQGYCYSPHIPTDVESSSSSSIPSPQPLPPVIMPLSPQPLPPVVKSPSPQIFIPSVFLHSIAEPPASDQRMLYALWMVASLWKRRKLAPQIVPRAPRPSLSPPAP
ncbi:hypothetical protein V9T40_003387 [Parthenolecanium corni]|uniref:Uncharacterized protein n=1 Tax=Parthenolecanium corni TaxID=536013 RepID=A0AAN9TSN0_9HEMI